jgi:pimeloyl-ACP methyl ester carboxylesterase
MTAASTADLRSRLLAGLPVTERRIELANVSTAILEGGSGPPLVLLHGPAANATHWASVIPGLVADHHVIVPDLPGHGESVAAGGPPDAGGTLAWLEELIARGCEEPPTLVGHALSGAIAARYASQRSDRLSGLVLVDSLGLAPLSLPPAFASALHEFVADPTDATHDALWQQCAHDLPRLRDRMGEQWETFRTYNVGRVRTTSTREAVGALMEQFATRAIPPVDLERIRTPTTLIWGRHDDAVPLTVAEAASARYGWRLEVIEDCADDPPVERPEALVEALRAALTASRVPSGA